MNNIPTKTNSLHMQIPAIGFGTWGMGGRMEHDPQNDDERDINAVRDALSQGITHIDTAECYADGYAETLVGKAIADFPRKDLLLASKVYRTNLAYDAVIKACEGSLSRLNTEYLDLYYIHFRNLDIPLKETAKALNALLKDGRVRNIGVCNFSVQSMQELQSLLDAPIAANQSHYNLIFREPERAGLIEHCQKVGATFIAWRPILWNDPSRTNQPKGSAWERGIYPILDKMADKYGKPNVQVAINWLINQPNICTLVKTTHVKYLQEILGSLEWEMSREDIEIMRKEFSDQREVSCAVPLG